MTTFSEVQFPAVRMLLCDGDEPHACDVPRVDADGATGPVECSACGARMALVDVITVDRQPFWGSMAEGGRTYTTAKLNPMALIAAAAGKAS